MTPETPAVPPTDGKPAVLDSSAVLGEAREVAIRHGAETYRLKLTRHGKLILTK